MDHFNHEFMKARILLANDEHAISMDKVDENFIYRD